MHAQISEGREIPPEFLDLAEGGIPRPMGETGQPNNHDTHKLMTWGMDEAGLGCDNQQQTEKFRKDLAELAGRDNQWFLLQYLKGPPEDPRLDETDLQNTSSPEQATWRLIDLLGKVLQKRRDKEKLNIERL